MEPCNKRLGLQLFSIYCLLVSMGFPGSLSFVVGGWIQPVCEYTAFGAEILLMLLSSGDNWLDLQIINLEPQYIGMYGFGAFIFIQSMAATRYPADQALTCARLIVTLLFAIWLQAYFGFLGMLRLMCTAQALFVGINVVFILLFPRYAFANGDVGAHVLQGLYGWKNNMAMELVFGIILMICLVRATAAVNRRFWTLMIVIQLILMLLCETKGAILTLAGCVVVLNLYLSERLPLGWIFCVVSVLLLMVVLTLMPAFEWFILWLGKDPSLTGRIPMWNQIIAFMMEDRTLEGYGFAMFWRDPQAVAAFHSLFSDTYHSTMTSGAHNTLMDLWLNVGLLGVAAYFGAILYSTRSIETLPDGAYTFCMGMLMLLLINGFTERCLAGSWNYQTLILFEVMAVSSNQKKEKLRIDWLVPISRE